MVVLCALSALHVGAPQHEARGVTVSDLEWYGRRPHIVTVLMDDLGWGDAPFTYALHGEQAPDHIAQASSHALQLANGGLVLSRHYTHWHCSPSRRAFLSGRFVNHISEEMDSQSADNLDLRMKTLAQKLEPAGYDCFWVGKAAGEGWFSYNSLAINRGFKGYLGGYNWVPMGQDDGGHPDYHGQYRWQNHEPIVDGTYSTLSFWKRAMKFVSEFPQAGSRRMFLWVNPQAVHVPYNENALPRSGEAAPGSKMLHDKQTAIRLKILEQTDLYLAQMTDLLKSKGMWANTLLLYSADNGGCSGSRNYPLRGAKLTNWEGGVRGAAFLAGGFLPGHLAGKALSYPLHIADWYPTFSHLAGVRGNDPSPAKPHSIAQATKGYLKRMGNGARGVPKVGVREYPDRYGTHSYPDVDGDNVWPHILGLHGANYGPGATGWPPRGRAIASATALLEPRHDPGSGLVDGAYALQLASDLKPTVDEANLIETSGRPIYVTEGVFVLGRYKLVLAQPDLGISDNTPWIQEVEAGRAHIGANWSSTLGAALGWEVKPDSKSDDSSKSRGSGKIKPCEMAEFDQSGKRLIGHYSPCLFDVVDDPGEEHDLASSQPALMRLMWRMLNVSRDDRFEHGVSPSELAGGCLSGPAHTQVLRMVPSGTSSFTVPVCGLRDCWPHCADGDGV